MAINSATTLQDALDQLNSNLSWEGNPAKAALALEAIRWIRINRPAALAEGGASLSYEDAAAMEKRLSDYVEQRGTAVKRTYLKRGRVRRTC